jgi:hypothetical protein
MAFAKKIGRAGMASKKINGPVHYSVCFLSEREETDLSTIITQKKIYMCFSQTRSYTGLEKNEGGLRDLMDQNALQALWTMPTIPHM